MRTKTLLLTAALTAAGVATSMAQVYSVNMVGYINTAIPAGFSLVANHLNASPDNKVTTLLPAPPNNTQAYKYNPATSTYDSITYITGLGWDDGGSGSIDMTANPGEGIFVYLDPSSAPSGLTVTFVGEVQLNSSLNVISGFQIYSSVLPQSLDLDGAPNDGNVTPPAGLGFPAKNGDTVYEYDVPTGTYSSNDYITGIGWSEGVAPQPAIGEAFFVNRGIAAPETWNRAFVVGVD